VLGITSDVLFPLNEQRELAQGIAGAAYGELESGYGHDGFLLEIKQIAQQLEVFYAAALAN